MKVYITRVLSGVHTYESSVRRNLVKVACSDGDDRYVINSDTDMLSVSGPRWSADGLSLEDTLSKHFKYVGKASSQVMAQQVAGMWFESDKPLPISYWTRLYKGGTT